MYLVKKWILTSIPVSSLSDQFGFRPSGSTTCALVYMMHHVTDILEKCEYVRCIMIDFSRAFDTVDHDTLLGKVSK